MKNVRSVNLFFLIMFIYLIFGGAIVGLLPQNLQVLDQYILIFLPVCIYILVKKKSFKETLRLNPLKFKDIILVILLTFAMQPFLSFVASIADFIFKNQFDFLFSDFENYSIGVAFFSIALTPAICEEVFLRGVMLDGYRKIDIKKAVLMNGFLFGIFHQNMPQFSYAFFMGIIFALVVYYTNSIFASMIMHFINNALSVVTMKFPDSIAASTENYLYNGSTTIDVVLMVVLAVISIIVSYIIIKCIAKNNQVRHKATVVVNCDNGIEYDDSNESGAIFTGPIIASTILFILISILITFVVKMQPLLETM